MNDASVLLAHRHEDLSSLRTASPIDEDHKLMQGPMWHLFTPTACSLVRPTQTNTYDPRLCDFLCTELSVYTSDRPLPDK